ncbi:MAG TPA: hypothetical protein VK761_03725 [Solirubrobacteraceae bacterium]|nr:hypothetical protein [Solirubrobacteraceae bacterium]
MPRSRASTVRRVETWLWTGPLGHLLGGALDVAEALGGHLLRKQKAGARRSSR